MTNTDFWKWPWARTVISMTQPCLFSGLINILKYFHIFWWIGEALPTLIPRNSTSKMFFLWTNHVTGLLPVNLNVHKLLHFSTNYFLQAFVASSQPFRCVAAIKFKIISCFSWKSKLYHLSFWCLLHSVLNTMSLDNLQSIAFFCIPTFLEVPITFIFQIVLGSFKLLTSSFKWALWLSSVLTHLSALLGGPPGCSLHHFSFQVVKCHSVIIIYHLTRSHLMLICGNHLLPISTSSWPEEDPHPSFHLLHFYHHQCLESKGVLSCFPPFCSVSMICRAKHLIGNSLLVK